MKTKDTKKGFRLINIIFVIIILIVFAGIYIPTLGRHPGKKHYNNMQCSSNLKQIGFALIMYSNDNDGKFPTDTAGPMKALSLLYPKYISEKKVFRCPSDKLVTKESNASIMEGIAFTANQCSYGYDNTHTQADDPGVGLASDRPPTTIDDVNCSPNHGGKPAVGGGTPGKGQNVVYLDGHVEFVSSPLAGWYDASGNRENIWMLEKKVGAGGATDTYIRHDGK